MDAKDDFPIPIFRNEINALVDFRGGVKVARDFAISLKRSTHIRQRSKRRPADYPIFVPLAAVSDVSLLDLRVQKERPPRGGLSEIRSFHQLPTNLGHIGPP